MMEEILEEKSYREYDGVLGTFRYDESMFRIQETKERGEYLKYIGYETNGELIEIPEGIMDLSYTFEYSILSIPPRIPVGVKKGIRMFAGSTHLRRGAAFVIGMIDVTECYKDCNSLIAGSNLPDTILFADHMYDGCVCLQSPVLFGTELQHAVGCYRNCMNMQMTDEQSVLLQDYVKSDPTFLFGCSRIEHQKERLMY